MADTRAQIEAEDWVRQVWMLKHLGKEFFRERVKLSSGGVFDFDAVTQDRTIVATISTSGSRTASGKHAVGKVMKIRSDLYFLLLADAERRLCVLTERDMYDWCLQEVKLGRVPRSIEFMHVDLPADLRNKLAASRAVASREVSPS